jgi:hypothetical protein
MPDKQPHPEKPEGLHAIPAPPKPKAEPENRRIEVKFRGRKYAGLVDPDGELIGWLDKLPRGSGSAEWRAAVKMAVM